MNRSPFRIKETCFGLIDKHSHRGATNDVCPSSYYTSLIDWENRNFGEIENQGMGLVKQDASFTSNLITSYPNVVGTYPKIRVH